MKKFIFYLLFLLLAVWLGIEIAEDPGYALFAYKQWTVEMPLWFALVAALLLILVVHNILLLIRGSSTIAKRFQYWKNKRRVRHSHRQTSRGLLELAEGKWSAAEKLLIKAAEHNTSPLINYLAAARAAQEQDADERRDDYLRMAHDCTPGAEIAVGLTQAELQYSHHQLEHSLATLRHLQNIVPHHAYVLKLLKHLYIELGDWESLLEILPELRKRKVIKNDEEHELEIKANSHLIEHAVKSKDQAQISNIWANIPKALRYTSEVSMPYINYLLGSNQHEEAEALIRDALKHGWNKDFILAYGKVNAKDPHKQLSHCEGWLKSHGSSPALLLSLGRLCIRNQLWGKAKSYLQSSIDIEPSIDAYATLGALLEYLGEDKDALQHYRQGIFTQTPAPEFN